MPLMQDVEFHCTVAVSRLGLPVLVSKVPSDFEGWIVDGEFPDDDGWKGLPTIPGLWLCRVRINWKRGDEPDIQVMEAEKVDAHVIDTVVPSPC